MSTKAFAELGGCILSQSFIQQNIEVVEYQGVCQAPCLGV